METKTMKTKDLIPADYNPRLDLKPGDPDYEKLKRSIENFGLVEPIIFNENTNRVVGGHQRLSVLEEMGYQETDVVIVNLSDDDEKQLNIALNKVEGDWDQDKLKDLLQELDNGENDLTLTGFDYEELEDLMTDFQDDETGDDDLYTDKVETPVYEPIEDEAPDMGELYDDSKTNELLDEIEDADIPEEVKTFLQLGAQRHIQFNYDRIAEYYTHASAEVQELMEQSALVIIDYDQAIEQGYVKLSSKMEEMRDQDNESSD